MAKTAVSDADWVFGLFGLLPRARDEQSRSARRYTNLHFNFADTTLGGSQAINTPPQYTLNCDPPFSGLFADPAGRNNAKLPDDGINNGLNTIDKENRRASVGSYRQGAFFHEQIYQHMHYAHFRFGKPKYSGIVPFFLNNYDADMAHLAKTGDYNSIVRGAGKWLGAAALYSVLGPTVFFPIVLTSYVLKNTIKSRASKYFYIKPTMHSYLRAVQSILDTQGLHHRLFPMWNVLGRDYKDSTDRPDMDEVYSALPSIWKENGKFDVYKMINRYQILSNYQARTIEKIYSEASSEEDYYSALEQHMRQARTDSIYQNYLEDIGPSLSKLEELFSKNPAYHSDGVDPQAAKVAKALDETNTRQSYGDNGLGTEQTATTMNISEEQAKAQSVDDWFDNIRNYVGETTDQISEQAMSELLDGGQWITWAVSNKEAITDTFSNSTREPDISSSLKGISSQARSLEVSTAGGNTGVGFVDAALKGVKDLVGGAIDFLSLDGLNALYNTSVIDFPEVYDSSTADVGSITLNFPLQSWSGHDLDLFQNISVPLAFWLAAVLPNSSGNASYQHPFHFEAYCPGKFIIREGIITNITITRGEGNLPFKTDGKMLGCTISVTLRDLSRIVHMPLIQDPGILDNDTKFSDYMSVLGSASMFQLTNDIQKTTFNLNLWKTNKQSYFMTGNATNALMNSMPMRQLSTFFSAGTAR